MRINVEASNLSPKRPKSSIEDQIKKYEQDWAQATVNQGAAAVDQYEADDIITTDPSGRVTDKAQYRMDLSSGDFKIQSEELSEIKVHGYGNAAVAVGTNTLRGTSAICWRFFFRSLATWKASGKGLEPRRIQEQIRVVPQLLLSPVSSQSTDFPNALLIAKRTAAPGSFSPRSRAER